MKQPCSKAGAEPAIGDVLSDPIVLSLMKADRVSRSDVLRAGAAVRVQTEPCEDRARLSA